MNTTRIFRSLFVVSLLPLAAACGDDTTRGQETGWVWDGTYDTAVDLDLSGPLRDGQSLGEITATAFANQLVERAGVPGFLESRARSASRDIVVPLLSPAIDEAMPPTLQNGGELHGQLIQALSSLEATTRLELLSSEDPNAGDGSDTLLSIGFVVDGESYAIPVADDSGFLSAGATARLDAMFTREDESLTLSPYRYEIRYGDLILEIAGKVAGEDTVAEYQQQAEAAIACDNLVDVVTGGGDSLSLRVQGQGFSVGRASLLEVCDAVTDPVRERALGLFANDTGLELGGRLRCEKHDSDAEVDALFSHEGYGGSFTALSGIIDAPVEATVEGSRAAGPE